MAKKNWLLYKTADVFIILRDGDTVLELVQRFCNTRRNMHNRVTVDRTIDTLERAHWVEIERYPDKRGRSCRDKLRLTKQGASAQSLFRNIKTLTIV